MDTIVTPVTVITLDSTRIVHSIKADLVARYFPPVVRLVQYDMSLPVIAVSLMQNGQTYTLPSGAAANIRVHKPDATYVYNPALGCDSTRNIVYFEVTQAMAAASGDGLAIVEIVVDGDIAGTSLITLHFEENPVPEDAIESSDEWETIYELGERIIASTVTPVSTAAGMTDHNVVYLYTGTESGWNQGHMYYYNGTTWVDAGIAVTDTTLSVAGLAADAKKTGDEIADLKDGLTAVESDVTDLKEDLYDITDSVPIQFTDGAYINLNGSTANINSPVATASYKYAVVECEEDDVFTISGKAGASDRVYGFVQSNGTIIKTSAYNEQFTDTVIVAPANSAYLVINTNDKTAKSYYGILITNKISDVAGSLVETKDDVNYLYDNLQNLELEIVGRSSQRIKYQLGRYIENGYSPAHKSYINNIGFLSPGTYSFTTTMSSNYYYAVVQYVSDTEGTIIHSFGNTSTKSLTLTNNCKICVRKLDGVNFTDSEIEYVMSHLIVDKLSVTQNSSTHIVIEKGKEVLQDYSVSVRSGAGYVNSNITVNGKQSFYVQNASGTLLDLRLTPISAVDPVGISEIILYVYLPDITKISTVGVEFVGSATFNRAVSVATLKTGWNKIHLYTADAPQTNWTSITTFRVYATGTAGMEMYFGGLEYIRPTIGNIIFVEDGGYDSFYTDGYPSLKALGVMTTWALSPGRLGVGGIITQEQIDAIASDSMSEFSFHSWAAGETSQMSASEIQEDAAKCIYYLRSHGLMPSHPWRAAHTQNSAPNADAQIGMVEALATGSSYVGYTVFPFSNPYNVPRRALHTMSTSDIDTMFDKIEKSHCTIVLYTHGIGTGTYEVTSEIWNYFLSKLEDALDNGYVRGTSFSKLETERLVAELIA